jgi:hypothetical protein
MEKMPLKNLQSILSQETSPEENTEVELAPADTDAAPQTYYDAEELAQEVRELLSKCCLEDMQFEEGQYHLYLDTLGSVEDAVKFLEVEVPEDEDLLESLDKKANEVAGLLNQEIGFPGSFFFDLDEKSGEYDLMFFFEDSDLKDLEDLGVEVKTAAASIAFTEIIAALELEGCHDIAESLHTVLFMGEQ